MSSRFLKRVNMVIHHGGCNDGFGSAFVVWLWRKRNGIDTDIVYHPASYGQQIPDVTGKYVMILDFSYKFAIMENMLMKSNQILIIDHHKTAEAELKDFPDDNKIFDMKHSGAMLTWQFCFPSEEPPRLIKYIEDRDIWTKLYPETDAFGTWLITKQQTFELFESLLDETYLDEVIKIGYYYETYNKYIMEKNIPYVSVKMMDIGNKVFFVGYLNSVELKSDIGNRICTDYPLLDFSAIYNINDRHNNTIFSLRSTDKQSDCSLVARSFGGGGHRNASGMSLPYVTNVLPGKVLDEGKVYYLLNNIYFSKWQLNVNTHKIVYMNITHHRQKMGKYLLQDRFSKDGKVIQNCQYIECCRDDKNIDEVDGKVDIACMWNYDGCTNKTHFRLVALNDDVQNEIVNYFGSTELTYSGVVMEINLS